MGKVGVWSYFIVYMYKILTNKENICYKATLHRCLHIKPSAVLSGAEPEAEREYNSWLEKSQAKGLCIFSPRRGKGGLLNSFKSLFNPDYKHSTWLWPFFSHSFTFCRYKASTPLEWTFLLSAFPPVPSQITGQSFQAPSAFSTSQPGCHVHVRGTLFHGIPHLSEALFL